MSREVTTLEEGLVVQRLATEPTLEYQGFIHTLKDMRRNVEIMKRLYSKPLENCTTPDNDGTFPTSDEQKRLLVKKLHDAIVDWTNYLEWKDMLPKDVKESHETDLHTRLDENRQARGPQHNNAKGRPLLTVDDLQPSGDIRERYLSAHWSVHQDKVLKVTLSNLAVECIS